MTHGFFQSTGGHPAAAPGPETNPATLKYLLFIKSVRDTEQARNLVQTGIRLFGLASLTPEQLELVTAHPGITNAGTFTYIDVNIAVLSLTRLKEEYDIDLARHEAVLPEAERDPGRIYQVDESPDGLIVKAL